MNEPSKPTKEVCWICDQHRYTLVCYQRGSSEWIQTECQDKVDIRKYPVIRVDNSHRIALVPCALFAKLIDKQNDKEAVEQIVKHLVGKTKLKPELIEPYYKYWR